MKAGQITINYEEKKTMCPSHLKMVKADNYNKTNLCAKQNAKSTSRSALQNFTQKKLRSSSQACPKYSQF